MMDLQEMRLTNNSVQRCCIRSDCAHGEHNTNANRIVNVTERIIETKISILSSYSFIPFSYLFFLVHFIIPSASLQFLFLLSVESLRFTFFFMTTNFHFLPNSSSCRLFGNEFSSLFFHIIFILRLSCSCLMSLYFFVPCYNSRHRSLHSLLNS